MFLIHTIEICSSVIAYSHSLLIEMKLVRVSDIIADSPGGLKNTIRMIWFTRILRRVLSIVTRTPLVSKCLFLVNNELSLPEEGCIITIPHTPWARLLAQWCRLNSYAMVFAGGPWIKRTGHVNVPGGGLTESRKMISHLRSNGYVIIVGDNKNRPPVRKVSYLGKTCNASTLPVRLASIANVSILAVTPKFENGRIMLKNGLMIKAQDIQQNEALVLQRIFSFFESEIYNYPAAHTPFILKSVNQ